MLTSVRHLRVGYDKKISNTRVTLLLTFRMKKKTYTYQNHENECKFLSCCENVIFIQFSHNLNKQSNKVKKFVF